MDDRGSMKYVFPSEMDHLEDEVEKELEGVQNCFQTKLVKTMIHEAKQGLSWFRAQVQDIQQGTETRMKNFNQELSSVREELDHVNQENTHLHEMVVFLAKQLNQRMSTSTTSTSSTLEESSTFLDELMKDFHSSTFWGTEGTTIVSPNQEIDEHPRSFEWENLSHEDGEIEDIECREIASNDPEETEDDEQFDGLNNLYQFLLRQYNDLNNMHESRLRQSLLRQYNDINNIYESQLLQYNKNQQRKLQQKEQQLQQQEQHQHETQQEKPPCIIQRGLEEFASWEKYNRGFATKMLGQMGYSGGGLGKHENGIKQPITVEKNEGRKGIGTRGSHHIPAAVTDPKRKRVDNPVKSWPPGTTLIIGDSMLGGIEEKRMKRYGVKVRSHPGACVDDLYDYITPVLKKKPAQIILHIGTNDSTFKLAKDIYDEIVNLKAFIHQALPGTTVYLSCPTLRVDSGRANRTVRDLDSKIKRYGDCVTNDNIDGTCLSKMGLHLNRKGTSQLAANYIKLMQSF